MMTDQTTQDRYLQDDPANQEYKEVDVYVPDTYQAPLFKAKNNKSYINANQNRKKNWINPINGKVSPIIEEWEYWSDEELVYVITHYQYLELERIASLIGRTKQALWGKIKEVKNNPDKYKRLLVKTLTKEVQNHHRSDYKSY